MENRWAFVTGISEGIGKTLSIKLVEEGYEVIGISRHEPKYIRDYPNIRWFYLDLSENIDREKLSSKIKSYTQSLHSVILNAAQAHYGKVMDMGDDLLRQMINTNLLSSIHIIKSLLPLMERGAQVVFVGSSGAYFPAPNNAIYGAMKVAQGHLAMSLNIEHLRDGIQFKVSRPGFTETPMADKTDRPKELVGREWYWNLTSEQVANDIIKLMSSDRFLINSGWVSKMMHVLSRISVTLCLWLSTKRHKNYV